MRDVLFRHLPPWEQPAVQAPVGENLDMTDFRKVSILGIMGRLNALIDGEAAFLSPMDVKRCIADVTVLRHTMRDLVIHVTHRPGEIARVANAMARKDVNIKSIAGMGMNNQGIIRVIPDDIEAARSALTDANIRFEESELVRALLENKAERKPCDTSG
jgi:hypothetical protein